MLLDYYDLLKANQAMVLKAQELQATVDRLFDSKMELLEFLRDYCVVKRHDWDEINSVAFDLYKKHLMDQS